MNAILAAILVFATSVSFANDANSGGRYQGLVKNTNPESHLPERISLGLVVDKVSAETHTVTYTGALRFYPEPYNADNYEEVKLTEATENYFTGKIHLKAADRGLTFKLNSWKDAEVLKGTVYSDSLEEIGKILLGK